MTLQMLRPSTPVAEGRVEPLSREWRQWLAALADDVVMRNPIGTIRMFDATAVDPTDLDQWTVAGLGVNDFEGWAIADGTNGTTDMSGLAAVYGITVAQRIA